MKRVVLCAVLLLLAGCGSTGGSSTYSEHYYDHGFRYGVYDEHYDVDVDVNRPDRPRPPLGVGPGRPHPPMARPGRLRPSRSARRMRWPGAEELCAAVHSIKSWIWECMTDSWAHPRPQPGQPVMPASQGREITTQPTWGLLRQYFPNGIDLSVYSQAQLNKVARELNERPRKTLNFETPAERFNACVAATGWTRNPNRPFKVADANVGYEITKQPSDGLDQLDSW